MALEIFIKFDSGADWRVSESGQWDYAGEYNEKRPLIVAAASVQMFDDNGAERVTEANAADYAATLGGGFFRFVVPTTIDPDKLVGIWFVLEPLRRAR